MMKRLALLLVIAGLLAGCTSGPAATPLVTTAPQTPTPTQAPTAPPATAAPTARPTRPPAPTLTADDERVKDTILDGFAELSGYIEDIGRAADVFEMLEIYRDLGSLAGSQQTQAIALRPGVCTEEALELWVEAMVLTENLADDYLAAWEAQNFDDFDPEQGGVAGRAARRAVDTLNAAC